jgi:hypothetical protein
MTTRRTTKKPLVKKKQPSVATHKPTDNSIKHVFSTLLKSKEFKHLEYIGGRLVYLLYMLGMGFLIQWAWNSVMIHWCGGEHQVNLFEAAILWVCIY